MNFNDHCQYKFHNYCLRLDVFYNMKFFCFWYCKTIEKYLFEIVLQLDMSYFSILRKAIFWSLDEIFQKYKMNFFLNPVLNLIPRHLKNVQK